MSANPYASPNFGFDGFFDDFIATRSGRYFPSGMSVDKFGWERNESDLRLYSEFMNAVFNHNHLTASLANAVVQKTRNTL